MEAAECSIGIVYKATIPVNLSIVAREGEELSVWAVDEVQFRA